MVMHVDGEVLIRYVCCDECGRWEVFENAGLGAVFEAKVVEDSKFTCRMCLIDRKFKLVETQIEMIGTEQSKIRQQFREHIESSATVSSISFEKIEELRSSIVSVEQKLVSLDNEWPAVSRDSSESESSSQSSSSQSVDESSESKIEKSEFKIVLSKKSQRQQKAELKKSSESRFFEHAATVNEIRSEVARKTEQAKSRVRLSVGGRTEPKTVESENSQTENKAGSFAEACKDRVGQFVVLSDSMLRGIISKLARDNPIFTGRAIGGAKIEDIKEQIVSDRVSVVGKHAVLCVGTNNLIVDGSEMIMRKYRELFESLRAKNCKRVSIVGMFYRSDVEEYLDSKRVSVNLRLGELCREFGYIYICPREVLGRLSISEKKTVSDVMRRVLNSSGLHFNVWGQNRLARLIFQSCVKYLN